jgi:DNA polymerase III subunit delta
VSKSRSPQRLSAADLVRAVQSGPAAPFYLLFGEEDFERDRAGAWLVEQLAPTVGRDFNLDTYSADEAPPQSVIATYQSYPMMAPHRLVVLRHCEKLTADNCRDLEAMVDSPMESSVVIALGGKLDMRRRLFQRLAKLGLVVEFRTPYESKLPQWIRSQARRAGANMDPEAADMLGLLVGRNLRELSSEIDKAITFVGQDGHITADVIKRLAAGGGASSVFDMADAVGAGNAGQALQLARQLVEHGEEPTRIVAMLSRHFQLLLRAQAAMANGVQGRDALASELGVSPYFVGGYLEQARASKPAQLWLSMGALLEADSRLKSRGRRQYAAVLETLVEQVCRRPAVTEQA